MKNNKRIAAGVLSLAMLAGIAAGCTKYESGTEKVYSYDEAIKELNAFNDKISTNEVKPQLDIYNTDTSASATLADINTFPLTVEGDGSIDIEVAAATEFSSDAPDDWMNIVAENFNKSGATVNGKSVSVTIRKITSGEVLTYMTEGDYKPDVYAPSSEAWGQMLSAKGIDTIELADRIAGNTAGVLMEQSTYDTFTEKYGEVTLENVLNASIAGDLTFAYTNPYTSSTGLNILTAMLYAFDKDNPLSEKAQQKLLDYQKQSPPVAYTTGVLRDQATKGIIKAMVMEEQAYHNTPELKNYVYTPAESATTIRCTPLTTFRRKSRRLQSCLRTTVSTVNLRVSQTKRALTSTTITKANLTVWTAQVIFPLKKYGSRARTADSLLLPYLSLISRAAWQVHRLIP